MVVAGPRALFHTSYRFMLVSDLDWTMVRAGRRVPARRARLQRPRAPPPAAGAAGATRSPGGGKLPLECPVREQQLAHLPRQVDHADATHEKLLRFNRCWATEFAPDSLLVFSTGRSPPLFHELAVSNWQCGCDWQGCTGRAFALTGVDRAVWRRRSPELVDQLPFLQAGLDNASITLCSQPAHLALRMHFAQGGVPLLTPTSSCSCHAGVVSNPALFVHFVACLQGEVPLLTPDILVCSVGTEILINGELLCIVPH